MAECGDIQQPVDPLDTYPMAISVYGYLKRVAAVRSVQRGQEFMGVAAAQGELMSQELKIEVDFRLDGNDGKLLPDEIALIYTMLPELIKLMQDMDEQNEAA